MAPTTLLKKLTARERQFLMNFMMSNCNNEYSFENFQMDVQMYKYPHEAVLYQLFPKYIGNYDLLKKDLESLVEKKCENHAHEWKNTKIHWDLDAKDVKCTICGEERHVEIDSPIGGKVI